MHKVFITYHHENDQYYKNSLLKINSQYNIFIDRSVDTGDISEDLDDAIVRRIIRDGYLQDSSVTILLVGTETRYRKHVDWELHSSMIDGSVNKKSGVLVVNLPPVDNCCSIAAHGHDEKNYVHPEIKDWITINSRAEYMRRYPCMPERIIDNLMAPEAYISVVPWEKANNPNFLRFLINATFEDRGRCRYDLRRKMKRKNSG